MAPVNAARNQRRQWREHMAERRRALTPPQRMTAAQAVRRQLEQLPEFLVDRRIAGYWASGGELPLNLAIAPLEERGQQFLLPVIGEDRLLRFVPWYAGEPVQPNRYGIPEPVGHAGDLVAPQDLDLVLVPLLGFDRHGHRLGFGGGYYDRSFAFLNRQPRPHAPLLVGVGYAFQELDTIAPEPWDVPLDCIVTDQALIDCRPPPEPEGSRA